MSIAMPTTASASRVLPTPPAPVRVTRRDLLSSRGTSANSRCRLTKLVNCAGRFIGSRQAGYGGLRQMSRSTSLSIC
jgi:hypothetical protein